MPSTMVSAFLKIATLVGFLHCVEGAYSPEMETEIRSETVLNTSYDAISRPMEQTHVSVSLNILAIDELDVRGQQFTAAGWLTIEWVDSRLKWDKAAKGGIEYIFAKPTQVWKPVLVIDNSLIDLGVIQDDNLHLRIRYDGTVDWEPLILFKTHCNVDITHYPYDEQKCVIELVSWGYNYDELNLVHSSYEVNLEDYVENGEWEIIRTQVEDKNLTEHTSSGVVVYPQLQFWFYLDRRSDYYNLNVMMPVFLTSLLVALVFVVPVVSGEKLTYVLTVLLSLAVLLTIVSESLPSTSITTSILGVYLGIVLIFSAVAVLLTVLIIMIYNKEGKPDKNSCIVAFARLAAKLTCTTLGKTSDVSDIKDKPVYDVKWQDISDCINRLCFIVFAIVTVVMNILFVLILGVGETTYAL